MKIFATEFQALDAQTGELKTWAGPNITAASWDEAQQWCYENAGHLTISGQFSSDEEE